MEQIATCNAVLHTFQPDSLIRWVETQIYVEFAYQGRRELKRWQCRGQDFYPMWYRKWSGGGTACTALAQLIRWLQGKPVLPLTTWEYWAGERVHLIKSLETIAMLRDAGYPAVARCVLCDRELKAAGFDWWSLAGVSGPCCHYTSGCRQKPGEVR